MLKRLLAVILMFCIILTLFVACGEDEPINAFYPISADPECLDPQIAENEISKMIVYNSMEGLVRIDKDGNIKPGVAESWTVSDDGLTYTFKLKGDSCWQLLKSHKTVLGEDYEKTFSTKVTAYDCAFGIERALRPETKAQNAFLLFAIKNAQKFNMGEVNRESLGIKATDENTLVITLERKYPDLLRVLAEPMCMPCDEEFFKSTGAKYGLELKYTLCNGPYYIGRWVEDGSLILYKNENYPGSFNTGAVYFYVNKNEEQYISKFNQGDYNAMRVSKNKYSLVNEDDDIDTLVTSNGVYGFVFNCNDSVLSDINIRKSLLAATERDTMFVDQKGYTAAKGVIPESCRWSDKSYREVAGDLKFPVYSSDTAVDYFKKGLDELDTTNINISIVCTDEFRNSVIRLIQKWEKCFGLAITVSVDTMEEEELDKAVSKGEYQIAFTKLSATDGNTLCFLENFCTDNSLNFGNYSDETYDKLIENCKTAYSGNDIIVKYKTAEQMLVNEGVFYPVYNAEERAYISKDLTGVFALPGFVAFDFAGWD